jgi:hypothetical protein
MEMNSSNFMKDLMEQWLNMPRKMAETAHMACDPVFEVLDVMMKNQKGIEESWERGLGKSNPFVKWPFDMVQSAFDYRYFYDSFEKAAESLQSAMKEEIDYWFEGQKKLRQSLIRFPK